MGKNANLIRGSLSTILDDCVTDLDDLALAVAVNNFLKSPMNYSDALAVYRGLLEMSTDNVSETGEPLRNILLNELASIPPITLTERIRQNALSLRKIYADAIAATLCRRHKAIIEHIKSAMRTTSADDLLFLAEGAIPVVLRQADGIVSVSSCPSDVNVALLSD